MYYREKFWQQNPQVSQLKYLIADLNFNHEDIPLPESEFPSTNAIPAQLHSSEIVAAEAKGNPKALHLNLVDCCNTFAHIEEKQPEEVALPESKYPSTSATPAHALSEEVLSKVAAGNVDKNISWN
jgi:hypothetical protein